MLGIVPGSVGLIFEADIVDTHLGTSEVLGPDINAFDWAPNEPAVVYSTHSGELWIEDADGAVSLLGVDDDERALRPVWSPDGSTIALMLFRPGSWFVWDIATMAVDGTDLSVIVKGRNSALVQNKVPVQNPSWSPTGSHLAYSRQESHISDIYRVRADGKHRTLLAEEVGSRPVWRNE